MRLLGRASACGLSPRRSHLRVARRSGSLTGVFMRQGLIAVVHRKLMRLNATAVSYLSPGYLVILVSNDVRRFDECECRPSQAQAGMCSARRRALPSAHHRACLCAVCHV